MLKYSVIFFVLISLSGCSAIKQSIVNSIKEGVTNEVVSQVDKKLSERGLSIQEIKTVADADDNGEVTRAEVFQTVRDLATDYVEIKLQDAQEEVESTKTGLWGTLASIILMVLTYVVRELRTSKTHGNYEARLNMLEKMLNRDLDGDGDIGDQPIKPNPEPVTPPEPATPPAVTA